MYKTTVCINCDKEFVLDKNNNFLVKVLNQKTKEVENKYICHECVQEERGKHLDELDRLHGVSEKL